jgi:hypothetical protein
MRCPPVYDNGKALNNPKTQEDAAMINDTKGS